MSMEMMQPDDEFREVASALLEKASDLEDAARKLGLYVEDRNIVPVPSRPGAGTEDMNPGLVFDMTIGDLAFSKRVQDPEQDEVDAALRNMTVAVQDDDFLDARNRIEHNLAAGREALDDGDDESITGSH